MSAVADAICSLVLTRYIGCRRCDMLAFANVKYSHEERPCKHPPVVVRRRAGRCGHRPLRFMVGRWRCTKIVVALPPRATYDSRRAPARPFQGGVGGNRNPPTFLVLLSHSVRPRPARRRKQCIMHNAKCIMDIVPRGRIVRRFRAIYSLSLVRYVGCRRRDMFACAHAIYRLSPMRYVGFRQREIFP